MSNKTLKEVLKCVPEIKSAALRGVMWEKVRNIVIGSSCTAKVSRLKLKFDIKVNEPMRMRHQITTEIGNLPVSAWGS